MIHFPKIRFLFRSKFNFAAGTFCDCHAFLNVYKVKREVKKFVCVNDFVDMALS